MASRKKTIRFRLTMGIIAVVLLANVTVSLVTVLHVNRVLLEEVQTRVTLDLNSARTIYNAHLQNITHFLHAISLKRSLAGPLGTSELEEI
ncbi:MAG: hypothetical protein FJ125_07335, partial [Deltaproteobacteria bacterium]|nr:hypothetical protein [Deltaproteobacteria bacterium]